MRDPRDLYAFESSDVMAVVPRGELTLVHALPGLADAGGACRIASAYLRDQLRHMRLVRFETDELLDYRGSRPQASFDGTSFTSVDLAELSISLMYDEADRPFLLLDGPEPDLQWRRLAQAVTDLVEFFEVKQVVGMQAVPMAVPHTRPIGLISHANDPDLLGPGDRPDPIAMQGTLAGASTAAEISVPASFGAFLEFELGRASLPALGYAAQIPHYLTRTDFPAGALALLRRVSAAAGLELPLVDLGDLTEAAGTALESTLAQNAEVGQIVAALEEQYDAMRAEGAGLLGTTIDMPTADEIGDHFERFLADHDADGREGPPRL